MKCIVCDKGPMNGITVYRLNKKGVPGVWACKEHVVNSDRQPLDPELVEQVAVLERLGR